MDKDHSQISSLPVTRSKCDRLLVILLIASLGLRLILARRGGQAYFPDESRFILVKNAMTVFHQGKFAESRQAIFSTADHLGFKVAMTLPAWANAKWGWGLPVMAMLSSGIFSVANIAWVYALAKRAGAGVEEARWAALMMAGATSMFYWARHLMPYDMALCLGLGCLFVAIHPAPRWYHSLLAGALGFCAFATYNGYWLIVAFALTVHVLRAWPPTRQWKSFLLRGVLGLTGMVGLFVALDYFAAWQELDLLGSYVQFSQTIVQGDFSDGYRIIGAYLWAAENGLLLLWLACLGWFLADGWRRPGEDRNRAWLWLGGMLTICLILILGSNVFQKFVVYGRLVRQMVPFFCLLGGWVLAEICSRENGVRFRWRRPVSIVLIISLAGFNFRRVFQEEFGFYVKAVRMRDAYLAQPGHANIAVNRFVLLYADFIWPVPPKYDLPAHEVLYSRPHPLQFQPFLYEGYNRNQRNVILSTDITARLVLLKN